MNQELIDKINSFVIDEETVIIAARAKRFLWLFPYSFCDVKFDKKEKAIHFFVENRPEYVVAVLKDSFFNWYETIGSLNEAINSTNLANAYKQSIVKFGARDIFIQPGQEVVYIDDVLYCVKCKSRRCKRLPYGVLDCEIF